ncbi:MAG: histidine phosphatase family protein [Paracoccaceae bacterium]
MTLWLIRHGPTHERAFTGWRDVPADLSDAPALGRLRALLPDAPIATSDLIRARATAQALGAVAVVDPDLRELNFGDWDGRHWSDVAATDPELSRAYWEVPGTHRAPGGESWDEAAARVSSAIDRLCARGPDWIVVAHMGAIMTQIARATGSALSAMSHELPPLSATVMETDPWGLTAIHRPLDAGPAAEQ